jgi:hypothetical protein
MAENRSSLSITGRIARRAMVSAIVVLIAIQNVGQTLAQPGGGTPPYQRKGTFAGDWQGGHHDKWRHRPMPQFSSQTSAGSFQRPYPYHLDYYRARWGGSYAPYFGNLYGPPNFFFGSPFFGGFNPWWGFGGMPFAGFGSGFNGFGGFESPGFGGEPFMDGGGNGPWQGFNNPAMAPMAAPFDGGVIEGPGPGF